MTEALTLDELRDGGILLEINRWLLNPVGLELIAARDGQFTIRPSDELGGFAYGKADGFSGAALQGLAAKAEAFRRREAQEWPARYERHGFLAEPLPGEPPRVVTAYSADVEGIWPEVEAMAADLVRLLPVDAETRDALAETLAPAIGGAVVAPLLGRLVLETFDGGATWRWRLTERPVVAEGVETLARCHYLLAEIVRLQDGGDVDYAEGEIREYLMRAKGELYEAEVDEFLAVRGQVEALSGRTVNAETAAQFEADLDDAHRVLERLYENAQPGMRLYRGDEAAAEAFQGHRERLRDAARGASAAMSEYERLQSGELHDFEAADWPALDARVRADLESATRACEEADRQMAAAIQARDNAQRSLSVVARALGRLKPSEGGA